MPVGHGGLLWCATWFSRSPGKESSIFPCKRLWAAYDDPFQLVTPYQIRVGFWYTWPEETLLFCSCCVTRWPADKSEATKESTGAMIVVSVFCLLTFMIRKFVNGSYFNHLQSVHCFGCWFEYDTLFIAFAVNSFDRDLAHSCTFDQKMGISSHHRFRCATTLITFASLLM